ncbi:hypothetical protein [Burkholderia sp. LMG 21824]|uniref:hypothetical protein n=1 Tax=Burkholderia sp. LMG 21824 TaxID=3158172 RepID=UPI003C2FC50E
MNERATELLIELAQHVVEQMRVHFPGWNEAYVRLEAPSDSQFGGRASYRSGTCVELIASTVHKEFFAGVLRILPDLRNALENNGRKFCVGLFRVNSHLQYQMDYEWNDPARWNITKLNGRSGLPDGLDGLPPLPVIPRE